MPQLPKATTTVSTSAGAPGAGLDVCCVLAPVAQNADYKPRYFGGAQQVYALHGYNEGVEYAALHAQATGKPILFVGMPIATPGAVSRENKSGNTGTSVTTVTAGGDGVLTEHDGVLTVITGGTIGTDSIVLGFSADGGVTTKRIKLGTATSYTPPYLNVVISFGAGTLVAGDTIHTWHASGPLSDATGWTAARNALAAELKFFRSAILCGDLQTGTEASNLLSQVNAYETENERFVYIRASARDRLPQAAKSRTQVRMTGAPTLSFVEVGVSGDTITRSAGSWIDDGFAAGDVITVTGAVNGGNNVTSAVIASLTATVLTLGGAAGDDLVTEAGTAGCTVVGTPRLTFAEVGAVGDTITRSRGSWLTDGFRVGDKITISGTASNNLTTVQGITAVTALTITLGTDDLAAEVIGSYGVTITAGQTEAAWMADIDSAFSAAVGKRLDISAGRGRVLSPFTGWNFRRPAGWAASLREYQPDMDIHVPVWRKDYGPVSFSIVDGNNLRTEWDDRVLGGAGIAAHFTCFRTWGNGPSGAFLALSLTRDTEGSILGETHNLAVANAACTIVQAVCENFIGRTPELDDDHHAVPAELATLKGEANDAIQDVLYKNKGQGKRCSSAIWTPSDTDNLSDPNGSLTGVLELELNGTIHQVNTTVRVK